MSTATRKFLIERGGKRPYRWEGKDIDEAEKIYKLAHEQDPEAPIRLREWVYDWVFNRWDLWYDTDDPSTWGTVKEA